MTVEYTTIFYWLGGVLTEALDRLTGHVLSPELRGMEAVRLWQALRVHADALALGTIDSAAYCSKALEISDSSLTEKELEKYILDKLKPNPEVLSIIKTTVGKYDCRLIVDLPDTWLSRALPKNGQFPFQDDHMVYLSSLKIAEFIPELFHALPASVNRKKEDCLMVDGNSARAVEAVQTGLSSIIYVTPSRLKHELALQGIFVAENEVLHPHSSERVEL